jgi:antimicrobial peptide system SdpB family protein
VASGRAFDRHAVEGDPDGGALLMAPTFAQRVDAWVRQPAWTSVIGLARSLVAFGTLCTVAFTPSDVLLSPLADGTVPPVCAGASRAGLWCVVPSDHRWLAALVTSVVLLLVISGWRPRYTGVLHWYVSWSLILGITLQDGGDQVAAVLTLLLIPITLTDPRRWHWSRGPQPPPRDAAVGWGWVIARVTRVLIMVQVAGIYLQASIAKLGVPEWADGTALWYWMRGSQFAPPPWISVITDRVIELPLGVVSLTYGTIIIEFLLAVALFMPPLYRRPVLIAGIALHAGIMVTMGLVSFFFSMAGALTLYLAPVGAELSLRPLRRLRRYRRSPELAAPASPPVTASIP